MSNYTIIQSDNPNNTYYIVMKDGVDVIIFPTRQEAEEYITQQENP